MNPRLALVTSSFPKLSETFLVSKFLGLLQRGWDAYIICGESAEKQWSHFRNLQQHPEARRRVITSWPHRPRWLAVLLSAPAIVRCFRRHPIGTARYLQTGIRRWGANAFRRLYLDAALLELKPDVIHFEFGALASERMYLQELLGCRIVVSFRGYDLNLSGIESAGYYDSVWRRADALHFLSRALWRRAIERGCPEGKPHMLIPPAIGVIEPIAAANLQRSPHFDPPLRILSVGRFTWEKGHEYAMQAVALLRERGIPFQWQIIGDGPSSEAIAFAIHQFDLGDAVCLAGALSPQDVRQHLQNADVFLHPSVSEGFGNAVIEAQAAGLPVVCSDAGGLPENVADGETGFVVPRRDARALAEKLMLLARNPELRRRMGAAGRARAQSHFGSEEQLERFDELYRKALDQGPAQDPERLSPAGALGRR